MVLRQRVRKPGQGVTRVRTSPNSGIDLGISRGLLELEILPMYGHEMGERSPVWAASGHKC